MKTILVTGATGLLGTILVPYLKASGYKTITHAQKNAADFLVDFSDTGKSFKILRQFNPSIIINLISLTSVDLCQSEPNMAYLANTRTVENIVFWIQKTGAKCHLIQISTDHLYDGSVMNSENEIAIRNVYAFSKYAAELAAARIPSSIIRTNFIGRSRTAHRESLSDWVYTSLVNGKKIQVLDDVYFSPLAMSTLIKIIQLMIEEKPIGVFNVGSHQGMSKADFAFAFAASLKLPTHTMTCIGTQQSTFLKAYRPKEMRMDCSKFENAMGIRLPQFSDEIIRVAKEYDELA